MQGIILPLKVFNIFGRSDGLYQSASKAVDGLNGDLVNKFLGQAIVPAISWNHAKILAVNGRTMMTGGGNYWREYLGSAHDIIDHQVKVKGDAAISGHKYADYFWKYVAHFSRSMRHQDSNFHVVTFKIFQLRMTIPFSRAFFSAAKEA